MNTAQIIARVRRQIGDKQGTYLKVEDVVDYINEAQLEIARETHYKSDTDTTHVGSEFITGVSFPNVLLFQRVVHGTRPLTLISSESIDNLGVGSMEAIGTPTSYSINANSTIKIWPLPAATDSTPVLVSYVAAPTDLVNENSSLDCPIKYHNDIAIFCTARAHERNENYRAAELLMKQFFENLGQRKYEGMSQDDSFYQINPDPGDWETYGIIPL